MTEFRLVPTEGFIRLAHSRFLVAPPAYRQVGCATPRDSLRDLPPLVLSQLPPGGFYRLFRVFLT